MTIKSKWIGLPKNIKPYLGMVYCITNLTNNKKYIGQKKLWFKKTLKPLKGKKRQRKSLIVSDYETYWGSSVQLQEDVEKLGESNFKCKVLYLCINKAEMNYLELWEQIKQNVMLRNDYYNGIIQVRIANRGLDRIKKILKV